MTSPAAALERLLAAGRVMAGFSSVWWVAGGWAIDAWTGGISREHADLEIGVLRGDVEALRMHLQDRGWQLERYVSRPDGGAWTPVAPGEGVAPPHFQLRARCDVDETTGANGTDGAHGAHGADHAGGAPDELEFFLNDLEDGREPGRWVSRRHPTVVLPLEDLVVASPVGLPVLAPEVQLLYKAKYHRAKDEHDFGRALPLLSAAQRAWLARTLGDYHPDDPWIPRLVNRE